MHAHYHTTSKLARKSGPRQALVRGLIDSLILYERISTTEAKAKVLVPQFERLVTRAKKGRLHDTRYVFARCSSPVAAQKLLYELAEGFRDRPGGYTRTIKTGSRRGDAAPMVTVELVLPADFDAKRVAAKQASQTDARRSKNAATDQSSAASKAAGNAATKAAGKTAKPKEAAK